ncbi:hypothetical protein TVAG_383550 [Trichomonas vaginalis G3]|uniref:Protein kinase domain-containing protein n=1 Tax=Trichomonas vaginalis (strain ATCC PRA-98 / G3) TaxID=412133 RepID=A2EZ64_TRIV3|nr:protein serine/threonine kinase protein [Trichomonas vaginalis G3]EAY02052.1 hypothetical protein TVAG_383550 [Trichomonas vaginalis G3]KAI5514283.1 protein serine/threonine kinase protein [Trichomonas vaginalis G3]|eukprot:XP_001330506.1 hypothetical protein [Trichomonas vaginalis G3]
MILSCAPLMGKRVPIKTVTKYFTEISDALCYMHDQGIAHCDIKLSNILIDSFGRAKLCDFGLAQFLKNANRINSTKIRGTLSYMSPEIMAGKGYDPFKADV